MRIVLDTETQSLTREQGGVAETIPLYSRQAFEILSEQWLKVGWDQQYSYAFTWLGRPIIQLPEDMVRMQEVICRIKPDVVLETGVAHGGSLIFSASLCQLMGKGRVIGVDIEIRPHNRKAIEEHFLSPRITLVQGDSAAPATVAQVRSMIKANETVLVVLDSNHDKQHVLKELEAYHSLVTPGSYIVATDGVRRDMADVPRGKAEWAWDHPTAAAEEFAARHPEFRLEQPSWPFNESSLKANVTYWPGAWLRRA